MRESIDAGVYFRSRCFGITISASTIEVRANTTTPAPIARGNIPMDLNSPPPWAALLIYGSIRKAEIANHAARRSIAVPHA